MDLTLILKKRYNTDTWIVDGNSYEGIQWLSTTAKPSEEELLSHWADVLQEFNAEKQAKADAKTALLDRLGITSEEAQLLLS
jgi:hypothetical protein